MPRGVTDSGSTRVRGEPRGWWPVGREVGVVLALYAAAGVAAGWAWRRLWDPPTGVVLEGRWYLDSAGLRGEFPSTGWFVLVSAATGLILGLVCAWLCSRSELATLVAVLAGAALATYLMWRVGLALSPEDPQELARTAADRERLPGQIEVSGRSPFLVLTGASLTSLALAFLVVPKRHRDRD